MMDSDNPLFSGVRSISRSMIGSAGDAVEIEFRGCRFFTDSSMQKECEIGDACGFVLDLSTEETLQQAMMAARPVMTKNDTLTFHKGDWLESTMKVEVGPLWKWDRAICDDREIRQIEALYTLCQFFSR